MIKTGWHPANGRMAFIALGRCLDMRAILAFRRAAVVATGTATRAHIDMIEHRGQPGIRRVTIVTDVAAGDVIRCLAICSRPVVAARTGAKHIGVVDAYHRDPARGTVTVIAQVRRLDMRGVLALGRTAVMATGAVTGNAGMIENSGRPGVCRVAVVAGVAAGDVVRCLALGGRPVVTVRTTTEHVGVVHPHHRGPAAVSMAVLAQVCRLDVRGILAFGCTAVMAAETTAANTGMIEVGR